MKKELLIKIEQNLDRIAHSLEQNNKNPIEKMDNKRSVFVWEAEQSYLRAVEKINAIELSLLKGIENQTRILFDNTLVFSKGYHANNALLWGAKGAGKSSLIKSVFNSINQKNKNLKLIEINREDLQSLPQLLNYIRSLESQFILYCDDLSFNKNDGNFKFLKSVLEGGIEGKPKNVVFYATSNIRHLISNEISENNFSSAISPSDNLNETISLSDRFGLWIGFHNIDQDSYISIIENYLKFYGIKDDSIDFKMLAIQWSKERGSRSGRVAWQFVIDIAGKLGRKI